MHKFVAVFAHGAAKRAGIKSAFVSESQQGAHVDADQFAGRDSDHGCERTVHAQDFVGLIVHDDEVADGVEDFHPMAIRMFDAGEQPGIFQGHGGVAGYGFEQVAIFRGERTGAPGKAEQTGEFSVGPGKTHNYQIIPS